MAGRVRILNDQLFRHAVRLVFTLALFVLHHAALQVELLLVEYWQQMSHAVAFGKERVVQHGSRHVLKVVGPVIISSAVQVGSANTLQGIEKSTIEVLTAAEHQVFKQVGKAGLSRLL